MAWVDPTERVNGDVLDDTLWNQDVVANTLALKAAIEEAKALAHALTEQASPIGEIAPFPFDVSNAAWADQHPEWLPCTGVVVPDEDRYQELRGYLSTLYDVSRVEVKTPDLRGYTIAGVNGATFQGYSPTGAEEVALQHTHLPVHAHTSYHAAPLHGHRFNFARAYTDQHAGGMLVMIDPLTYHSDVFHETNISHSSDGSWNYGTAGDTGSPSSRDHTGFVGGNAGHSNVQPTLPIWFAIRACHPNF